LGYFCVDAKDTVAGKPVFNRIVPLRDSWMKTIDKV
jgi:glutaminyl-tRNA synthetase